jgi:hypothetical protein
MNKLQDKNFQFACENYKNIAININEFCDLLSEPYNKFLDPVTHRQVLQNGLYGNIFGANCFVSKNIPVGHIQVSLTKEYQTKYKDLKWSIPVSLNSIRFDAYFKLQAFW